MKGGNSPEAGRFSTRSFLVWIAVSLLAAASHLAADLLFSGTPQANWPIMLLWPFSRQGWAVPVVPWGDIVATLLFVAEMFALYRWPARDRVLALGTLLAVAAYVGGRAFVPILNQ